MAAWRAMAGGRLVLCWRGVNAVPVPAAECICSAVQWCGGKGGEREREIEGLMRWPGWLPLRRPFANGSE